MNKSLQKKLEKEIRVIPDFPLKGVMFQDIFSITENPKLFKDIVNELSNLCKKYKITKVAGIEARGFIFGALAAYKSSIPFVPIRKKGKLPGKIIKKKYKLEYGTDQIEIQKHAILNNDKVMVIDDLIATGGTAIASCKLLKSLTVKKLTFCFIIDLQNLGGSEKLKSLNNNVISIVNAVG
ncbi:MAG: adenine phosphoribosyltransferase [Gammaproteobacteria bacterium]|nr:adenine phosphoribosyltransferase [Gammaproteobacteria bacterium]